MWKFLIIIALFVLACYIHIKFFKILPIGTETFITGAVKSGKSLLSVYLLSRYYTKNYRKYKFKVFLRDKLHLFKNKLADLEEPLIYSNIPLNCKYVPLTLDLLMRKVRFNYGSICYINETSLVADNTTYKDEDVNKRLNYFCKLYGHETKGGYLIFDTQACGDVAIGIRRCINTNLFVHHNKDFWLFRILYLVEERYSEDSSTTQVYDEDVEDKLKRVIILRKYYKLYDRYCYSVFTDNKDIVSDTISPTSLKAEKVINFKYGELKDI